MFGSRNQNAFLMRRLVAVTAALALVVAACTSSRSEIEGAFLPPNDSETTTTSHTTSPSTSTTLAVPTIETQIEDLIQVVEEVRGLAFREPPELRRVADDVVQADYRRGHSYSGANDEGYADAFLRMLGVLDEGQSIRELEVTAPVPGVYHPETGSILISSDEEELTPFGRLVLFGELVAAVTDQQFAWADRAAQLEATGDDEGADSLRALVKGDATFFSDAFLDRLSATDQFAVQLEGLEQLRATESLPNFVREFKDFETKTAGAFVEAVISEGGLGALNDAYENPPTTTEQVYHTFRYFDREAARTVDLASRSVAGFEEVAAGTFGERGLRALLSSGVSGARQLEASTGWGGDGHRLWWDGENTVMFLMFEGDAGRDATSLAETLGRWAIEELPVGGGLTDNTGLAFEGVNSYAFVAQAGTNVLFVVGSDPVAAKRLRDSFWPEY